MRTSGIIFVMLTVFFAVVTPIYWLLSNDPTGTTALVLTFGLTAMLAANAVAIAEALLPGAGAVVGQVFDINDDLSGDNDAGCDALSSTYSIGGVVVAPAQ